jgi:SAM-dependent methyltransferase
MAEPWYINAFDKAYLELYRHRSPEQGVGQVRAMLDSGLLPRSGRVLDLCCGAGRHLLPMREAGLAAVGLDLSLPLLRAGALAGVAVRGDMRRLPFATGCFDVVVNLFTSFGYFESEADNRAVLAEVRRVLKPGGRLVLDHMNAQVTVRELVPESVDEREGYVLRQSRSYHAESRRVHKDVHMQAPDGSTRHWHESVRVLTPAELDATLAEAGLHVTARHADFDGANFDERVSPRQVVVAKA